MGMTIGEKILARKGGLAEVVPGDLVTVGVDTVALFDNNFMPSIWQKILSLDDPQPLEGSEHDRFGFSGWEAELIFDNLKVEPL